MNRAANLIHVHSCPECGLPWEHQIHASCMLPVESTCSKCLKEKGLQSND